MRKSTAFINIPYPTKKLHKCEPQLWGECHLKKELVYIGVCHRCERRFVWFPVENRVIANERIEKGEAYFMFLYSEDIFIILDNFYGKHYLGKLGHSAMEMRL